jgi:hypothetical protein
MVQHKSLGHMGNLAGEPNTFKPPQESFSTLELMVAFLLHLNYFNYQQFLVY